jgi:hypothetical protein
MEFPTNINYDRSKRTNKCSMTDLIQEQKFKFKVSSTDLAGSILWRDKRIAMH